MAKKFYPRTGSPFKKKHVQAIGMFIENINNKTSENILEHIKSSPDHVIHDYITWDDGVAAESYRLQQVRNIVNHIEVRIVDNGNSTPVRAFYALTDEKGTKTSFEYVSVDDVFSNEHKRGQVITRAKTELKNWRDRYKSYNELHDVVSLIEPFIL